jgi:valyl-tRNA synthetase
MSGGRTIPVIADDYVDMEFGTGALKITPGEVRAVADIQWAWAKRSCGSEIG